MSDLKAKVELAHKIAERGLAFIRHANSYLVVSVNRK
jgi:hypothetical protein